MIGLKWRPSARLAALLAMLLLTALAAFAWPLGSAASTQRVLSVTAYPTAVPARGGESRITVRIPADAVGDETRVSLSTDLGAFTASSGPAEVDELLHDVGNDIMGASVKLVADGRSGPAVVRARVGSLVGTVTVRFVGDTASLRLVQPAANARLDASRQHLIRIAAVDDTNVGAPSAAVSVRLVSGPDGAQLRSGADSSTSELSLRTLTSGEATFWLSAEPGDVRLRVTSGNATLSVDFQLYGEPNTLRIVPISGAAIEASTADDAGTLQVLLLDERGQGVPDQRISFVPEGGLVVRSDGDGESLVTDNSGTVRAHLDARTARLGNRSVTANWSDESRSLSDSLEVRVTGPPVAIYLTAVVSLATVEEVLIEEFDSSTRYRVEAEVVDRMGQRVAGAYRVRWRALIMEASAQVYPEVSVTQNGVAMATFDLQHVDSAPQPEQTSAQAWLISKAQVNSFGVIADLVGSGTALRSSWNDVIWCGAEMLVSEAVQDIEHVVTAAWRWSAGRGWDAWFSADVPGAIDFKLQSGDSFNLVLESAALLEDVKRQDVDRRC